MPINITSEVSIEDAKPIVILGPNGSGKTQFGVRLANQLKASRVAAQRSIAMPKRIGHAAFDQAEKSLSNVLQQGRNTQWTPTDEMSTLFTKLKAEEYDDAMAFREKSKTNRDVELKETKLERLATVWKSLFPGRNITFDGYEPKVTSEHTGKENLYSVQVMSDGERTALLLLARVLDSDPNVIIVDEPEAHFHSRLAVRFWDEMERIRSDCQFVYITHDLNFALSRQTTNYLIARPGRDPELVDLSKGIPAEIAEQVLSAASFAVFAETLVFCEGTESSLDQKFFRGWYKKRETAVIPVGACKDVIRCAETFQDNNFLANVTAIGIIDQDYWPDTFLASLPNGVTVLPVHEIESLFCYRGVFKAVATHLGTEDSAADAMYAEFLTEAKGKFVGGILNKQISQRFRTRCEQPMCNSLNSLRVCDDLATLRDNHCEALSPQNWSVDPGDIFDEEVTRLNQALCGGEDEFLRMFPGKVYLGILVDKLGIKKDRYTTLIADALRCDPGSNLSTLGESIRLALDGILPKED